MIIDACERHVELVSICPMGNRQWIKRTADNGNEVVVLCAKVEEQ